MKHALALLLLSCALVAQDKPAVEAPKPAAVKTAAEPKPKVPPINVRDELIELVHQLKPQAFRKVSSPYVTLDKGLADANIYDADLKARAEAQRLLLQALVELAKDSEKNGAKKVYHSSNPPNIRDE
jgi:hypothetical protein